MSPNLIVIHTIYETLLFIPYLFNYGQNLYNLRCSFKQLSSFLNFNFKCYFLTLCPSIFINLRMENNNARRAACQLWRQKLHIHRTDEHCMSDQVSSVRRFLQKTENRPKKTVNRFLKIRSKIKTTVKKDTTRYSVLTQGIKRKVF